MVIGSTLNHADEKDELLIEFKNTTYTRLFMSLSKFATLVSAVCMAVPSTLGHLPWAGAVSLGWRNAVPIKKKDVSASTTVGLRICY